MGLLGKDRNSGKKRRGIHQAEDFTNKKQRELNIQNRGEVKSHGSM